MTTENVTVCLNTYQYLTLDPTEFSGFDLILGDAFLRSVYALYGYPDVQDPRAAPYIQMLSVRPPAPPVRPPAR